MSAKSPITAEMKYRNGNIKLQTLSDGSALIGDDTAMYFGSDGDVLMKYNSTRKALVTESEGDYLAPEGMNDRVALEEHFLLLPQLNAVTDPPAGDTYNTAAFVALLNANRNFEILGANAANANVTARTGGGITVVTAGAATDSTIVLPHLNTGQSPWTTNVWDTSKSIRWECDIITHSAIADTTLWYGLKLTNTATTATDDNQVFFRFHEDTNGGKWQAIYSIGGTDTAVDSGVTVAVSTRYHFVIEVDSSRIARFYINSVLVATSTAIASITTLIPYLGILSDTTGTAKTHHILRQRMSKAAA